VAVVCTPKMADASTRRSLQPAASTTGSSETKTPVRSTGSPWRTRYTKERGRIRPNAPQLSACPQNSPPHVPRPPRLSEREPTDGRPGRDGHGPAGPAWYRSAQRGPAQRGNRPALRGNGPDHTESAWPGKFRQGEVGRPEAHVFYKVPRGWAQARAARQHEEHAQLARGDVRLQRLPHLRPPPPTSSVRT
jgi:hypothetical protein